MSVEIEETVWDRWGARIIAIVGIGFVPALVFGWPLIEDHIRVTRCEAVAKEFMKAPAAFRVAHANVEDWTVELAFDAPNGFGVPLRGRATCFFSDTGLLVKDIIINGGVPTKAQRDRIRKRLAARGDDDVLSDSW